MNVDESNFTHARCECTHLTSFAAAAKKAACKFCKVDMNKYGLDKPHIWIKQRWDEPAIWLLLGLLAMLYAPCFLLCYRDCKDWIPMKDNQGVYFKDELPKTNGTRYMLCPPFRICMGCIIIKGFHCTCPPICCRRKDPNGAKAPVADLRRERQQSLAVLNTLRRMQRGRGHWNRVGSLTDIYHDWFGKFNCCYSFGLRRLFGMKGPDEIDQDTAVILRTCYELTEARGSTYQKGRVHQLVQAEVDRQSHPVTAYLPIMIDNTEVMVATNEDGHWEPTREAAGLKYRKTKNIKDEMEVEVPSGAMVKAVDEGDGWLKCQVAPKAAALKRQDTNTTIVSTSPKDQSWTAKGFDENGADRSRDGSEGYVLARTPSSKRPILMQESNAISDRAIQGASQTDVLIEVLNDSPARVVTAGPIDDPTGFSAAEVRSSRSVGITLQTDSSAELPIAGLKTIKSGTKSLATQFTMVGESTKHTAGMVPTECDYKGEEWIEIFVRSTTKKGDEHPSVQGSSSRIYIPYNEGSGTAVAVVDPLASDSLPMNVKFEWKYHPYEVVNLGANVARGTFSICRPHASWSAGSLPAESQIAFGFSVFTGTHRHETWFTNFIDPSPGESQWTWTSKHTFAIWRFHLQPMVTVHVTAQNIKGIGLLVLDRVAEGKKQATLPLQALDRDEDKEVKWGSADITFSWHPLGEALKTRKDGTTKPFCSGMLTVHHIKVKHQGGPSSLRPVADTVHVDTRIPARTNKDVTKIKVPHSGRVEKEINIRWTIEEERLGGYFKATAKAAAKPVWMATAKRTQFMTWSAPFLALRTFKRETPFLKCLNRNVLISRKQRYAILTCALVFGGFLSTLFFQPQCQSAPPPPMCAKKKQANMLLATIKTMISFDALFATFWGIAFAVPIPMILIPLFKKEVREEHTGPEHKLKLIRFMKIKERIGWCFVCVVHCWCVLCMTQFVRYYSWPLLKKWFCATANGLFYRFFAAPGIRMVFVIVVLLLSKTCFCCDHFISFFPTICEFPFAPVAHGQDFGDEGDAEDGLYQDEGDLDFSMD